MVNSFLLKFKNYIFKLQQETVDHGKLKELYLADNSINDLHQLDFSNANLQLIGLSRNGFTEFPIELINSKIKALDISYNEIQDLPDNLIDMKKLDFLNIGYNKMTSIPEILFKMRRLTHLRLKGNLIPAEDIQRLRKKLPMTNIIF